MNTFPINTYVQMIFWGFLLTFLPLYIKRLIVNKIVFDSKVTATCSMIKGHTLSTGLRQEFKIIHWKGSVYNARLKHTGRQELRKLNIFFKT